MRGRNPKEVVLKRKGKIVLQALLRNGQTPLKVARRAQILLGRTARRQRVIRLGEKVERDPATIWRICERYRQGGLEAALYDAPRCGHPRVFSLPRAHRD